MVVKHKIKYYLIPPRGDMQGGFLYKIWPQKMFLIKMFGLNRSWDPEFDIYFDIWMSRAQIYYIFRILDISRKIWGKFF